MQPDRVTVPLCGPAMDRLSKLSLASKRSMGREAAFLLEPLLLKPASKRKPIKSK